jgi:hypothetical protein
MTIIEARKRSAELCADIIENKLKADLLDFYYDDGAVMREKDTERMKRAILQVAHNIRVMYRPKRIIYKP